MDEDQNGRLSITELRMGLRRLNTQHQVAAYERGTKRLVLTEGAVQKVPGTEMGVAGTKL